MADIVILDDSEDLLEVLEAIFKRHNHTVRCTSNIYSFYKEQVKAHPDVAFVDVILSDGDGREVCKKLKAKKQTKDIPIILMSASPKTLKNYQNCNADGIIEKPFDLNDLFKILSGCLKTSLM